MWAVIWHCVSFELFPAMVSFTEYAVPVSECVSLCTASLRCSLEQAQRTSQSQQHELHPCRSRPMACQAAHTVHSSITSSVVMTSSTGAMARCTCNMLELLRVLLATLRDVMLRYCGLPRRFTMQFCHRIMILSSGTRNSLSPSLEWAWCLIPPWILFLQPLASPTSFLSLTWVWSVSAYLGLLQRRTHWHLQGCERLLWDWP